LTLNKFSSTEVELATEVTSGNVLTKQLEEVVESGALTCHKCSVWYPVMDYVPVLLVFSTTVHDRFAQTHAKEFGALKGFTPPKGKPEIGEKAVQDTFTDEWNMVQDNELSFIFTSKDLVELNRQVWLRALQDSRDQFKIVLNVGVGLGQETNALKEAVGNCEIIGVDLNFAILHKGRESVTTPGIQFVVASLYHLPFKTGSFDLVYSQGVLHHTYSTKNAFDAIEKFVAPRGSLFIWVYSLDSHLVQTGLRGMVARIKWGMEQVLRPTLSRSPKFLRDIFFSMLTVLYHPLMKGQVLHGDKWTFQNTNHQLRDLFSPRFAHRHSYNQVFEWFENAGFRIKDVQSTGTYRRLFGKQMDGVGVLGERESN